MEIKTQMKIIRATAVLSSYEVREAIVEWIRRHNTNLDIGNKWTIKNNEVWYDEEGATAKLECNTTDEIKEQKLLQEIFEMARNSEDARDFNKTIIEMAKE